MFRHAAVLTRFKLGKDFLGSFDNGFGHPGKGGNLNAVASVGSAGDNSPQEGYVVSPLFDGDVKIVNALKGSGKTGKLMIMCGKHDLCAEFF